MRWPVARSAPDHPEYGARALLGTSVGRFVLTVWTDQAWSVQRLQDDGWTVSAASSFGAVEPLGSKLKALGTTLESLGLPSVEAERLAAEVVSEWRERWQAREREVHWPLFDLAFYGATAFVAVPLATGAAVMLSGLVRLLRRGRG